MSAQVPIETAVTYRLIMFRLFAFIVFPLLGLVGVAMLVNLLAGGVGPPAAFMFLWLGALGWNAYWFLVRFAYEIGVVDGSILRWRSVTARHEVPLHFVRGIKTWIPPFGIGTKQIIVDGHRSPLLIVTVGFDDVVAMLVQFRPDLVIQDAWYDRLVKRFAKRSMYWRRVPPR
jgi:hypothetical protein